MKQIVTLLFLLATSLAFAQATDTEQIRQTFDSYKAAILAGNGEEAIMYVDSNTIRYYGEMLDHVRKSDSTVIRQLPILDKLMIFVVRHRVPREDILSFNAQSLLKYAIQNGMVGKNSVLNNTIGDISIENGSAKAQLVVDGNLSPLNFEFNHEDGMWKLDLTSVFKATGAAFQAMADGSEMNEDEYIFTLLEMMTARKPGAEIWAPVN